MLHANFMFFNFSFLHVNISELKREFPYLNAKKIIKSLSFHFSFSYSYFLLLTSHSLSHFFSTFCFHSVFYSTYHHLYLVLHRSRIIFHAFFFCFLFFPRLTKQRAKLTFLVSSTLCFCIHTMLKVINCNVQINKTHTMLCSAARFRCTTLFSRRRFSQCEKLNEEEEEEEKGFSS
jgi:hypothetical protein